MPAARPASRTSPVYKGTPPARQRPTARTAPDDDVDSLRLAGILLCGFAVLSAVLNLLAYRSTGSTAELSGSLGSSVFALLLGAALIQGVGAARLFVLAAAILGGLAALAVAVLLRSVPELRLLSAGVLATVAGMLTLLLRSRVSNVRAVIGAVLVVTGGLGSAASQLWLASFQKRAFGAELRRATTDERRYADSVAGLSFEVPAGWGLLRRDQIFAQVPAKVVLGDPDAGVVAFLDDEPQPAALLTLDHYLDAYLRRQTERAMKMEQRERTDVMVGKAAARRMSMRWVVDGDRYNGFVSAWQDGDRVFTLVGAAVGDWTSETDARFQALEGALRFTAPAETGLSDAEKRLAAECPLFLPSSARMIARRIPPDSPARAYFRAGLTYALRGQTQMDPRSAAELRALMGAVYARMSAADRERFGRYTERLRANEAPSSDDDEYALRAVGRAAAGLPAPSLSRIQVLTDTAITVGGLL